MGLLDKIESVLPGHHKDSETTTHDDTARTDSAVGERGTTHPHLSHSQHGAQAAEHSTVLPASTTHQSEHTIVPTTTTTIPAATSHGSKSQTSSTIPSSTVHTTTTQIPADQTTGTTADPANTGIHTAGTKLDGSTDVARDTSSNSTVLPPLAGSASTGHPAPQHELDEYSTAKHDRTGSGVLGHRNNTDAGETQKSEHGISGLVHSLTGSHNSRSQEESSRTDGKYDSTSTSGARDLESSTAPVTTRHGHDHKGTNFVPNAENPSAIPTAGGRVIGAGQVDHDATGTIGTEYPGDKTYTGNDQTSHTTTSAPGGTTSTVQQTELADRTAVPTSGTSATTQRT